jgi:formylglycine-generating enzyme required for sulfatase activity
MSQTPIMPEFLHVPAGPFTLGTSAGEIERLVGESELAVEWREKDYFGREQPQHTLSLPDYYIARYPVTVAEYRRFVEVGGYGERRLWTATGWEWRAAADRQAPSFWDDMIWTGADRLPVVGVSWYEAHAYCCWLGEISGKPIRLPSEAEWEKAARGTDRRLYPWGEHFDAALCNTRASGLERTLPVDHYGPRAASPYGCADMAGNASEWTASLFQPYPYELTDGRDEEEHGAERVTRGGSWFKPALRARVTARGLADPFFADNDVGFRCACSFLE